MNWRDYEAAVSRAIRQRFPADRVRADQALDGRFSGVPRQIDVLADKDLVGRSLTAVVDCKCYARNVDVKDVEAVIGLAADVRADVALVVTTRGYSTAARARAENEPNVRAHLSIVTVDDLELGGAAFPVYAVVHHGQTAVGVVAPSGWFVTSNAAPGGGRRYDLAALAVYHAPELTYDQARRQRAFGWTNISWWPDDPDGALDGVLDGQEEDTLRLFPGAEVGHWEEVIDNAVAGPEPWVFRTIVYPGADYIDVTCFRPVGPGYVFYTVLLTTHAGYERDLDRLRQLAASCVPMYAPHVDPSDSDGYWRSVMGPPPDNDEPSA